MSIAVAVLGVLLAGCTSSQARLSQLEAQAQVDDEVIADLSERVAAFERTVDELVNLYQQASDALETAERKLELAGRSADASSRTFQQAASEYEAASRNWRLVTISLLTAASWDYAGHLCDTRMTTAAYRKMLRKEGVDLDGLDADHGLPNVNSQARSSRRSSFRPRQMMARTAQHGSSPSSSEFFGGSPGAP